MTRHEQAEAAEEALLTPLSVRWPVLRPASRRIWERVVAREARAVYEEAARAFLAERPPPMPGPTRTTRMLREIVARRRERGMPAPTTLLDLTPWRTEKEARWTDAELRAAHTARCKGRPLDEDGRDAARAYRRLVDRRADAGKRGPEIREIGCATPLTR